MLVFVSFYKKKYVSINYYLQVLTKISISLLLGLSYIYPMFTIKKKHKSRLNQNNYFLVFSLFNSSYKKWGGGGEKRVHIKGDSVFRSFLLHLLITLLVEPLFGQWQGALLKKFKISLWSFTNKVKYVYVLSERTRFFV